MTDFLRALVSVDKAAALRAVVLAIKKGDHTDAHYHVDPATFGAIPGAPFAYWASSRIRQLFRVMRRFEANHGTVKQGLATTDDFRFVRAWWEPNENGFGTRWFLFSKGGNFSPYYCDLHLCVDWRSGGAQSWAIYYARRDVVGGIIKNPDYYFRSGLTWPLRTHRFCPQLLPAQSIISVRGSGIFCKEPLTFLGLFSGTVVDAIMKLASGRDAHPQFDMGDVSAIPIPTMRDEDASELARLARRAWSLKRTLDTVHETSHAFLLPTALRPRATAYDPPAIDRDLAAIQREIDDIAFRLYGLEGADRSEIEAWAQKGKSAAPEAGALESESSEAESEGADEDPESVADDRGTLLSWCIGVALGRFDVRLATGQREAPPEPEPFDPLPARSPGMLPEGGAPFRPTTGILVDDRGHADDLTAAAKGVLERVALPAAEDLRPWLGKEFFPLHLQMYSKSRRKAPIYWQLATPSASYSVWLYLHAFSKDTLYKVQNDYATAKLHHEERKLETMRADYGPSPTAAARKALAPQEAFVEELRTFLEEVKRVAPLWNPDLDDGVIINFAPLWRLVPQHRAWQREVKATWDALCAGDYDWAHLAMHLWPERVVPKCAGDRSLAIAHGLEETFWAEDAAGKWKRRPEPTRPLGELVKERTSTAVKAALHALLAAPTPGGAGAAKKTPRTARGKGTSSSA